VSDVDLALTAPTSRPVAAQHEFDRERLAALLRERIGWRLVENLRADPTAAVAGAVQR
jgi:hypothetical protein